jgi:general secretion pathway protein K
VSARSLGGRRISVQTAEKSVSFVDTSSANSYGYWLVGITKRYSIFDSLPSKPSAAQTPSLQQRGAALLTAMLVVTLVATIAAAGVWQQWRGVEVEAAERQRQQSAWVLVGALDWARLLLRIDAQTPGADHLAEPWAVPLQEARLSSFLAQDKANSADLDLEAFLSGVIVDGQSRLNVRNLAQDGRLSEGGLRAFSKLYEMLGLQPQELLGLAESVRAAADTSADNAGGFAPLMPQRLGQLQALGLSEDSISRLEPYITVLPDRTPLNLNTASAEAIYASVPELDLASARRLVQEREKAHFKTLVDVGQLFPQIAGQFKDEEHSVSSKYFEVTGILRLGDTAVQERSLVRRDGLNVRVEWRERFTAAVPDPAAQAPSTIKP